MRFVFERQDLQRVRLAHGADPMWELVLSLQVAQSSWVPTQFVGWRQSLETRLTGDDGLRAGSPLPTLVAPLGDFPDFLTPAELITDLDAGCEALACTPRARLSADLAAVFRRRPATTWVRSLAAGGREHLGAVVRAARDAHNLLVAPHWANVHELVAADRCRRAHDLATRGVGPLLASLPGVLSWDGQVLHVRYPAERTVHLAGRGLTLLPSYFCWGRPVTWIDAELPRSWCTRGRAGRGGRTIPPRRVRGTPAVDVWPDGRGRGAGRPAADRPCRG